MQEAVAPVPHWDTTLRCQGGASMTHLHQEDDRHRSYGESPTRKHNAPRGLQAGPGMVTGVRHTMEWPIILLHAALDPISRPRALYRQLWHHRLWSVLSGSVVQRAVDPGTAVTQHPMEGALPHCAGSCRMGPEVVYPPDSPPVRQTGCSVLHSVGHVMLPSPHVPPCTISLFLRNIFLVCSILSLTLSRFHMQIFCPHAPQASPHSTAITISLPSYKI